MISIANRYQLSFNLVLIFSECLLGSAIASGHLQGGDLHPVQCLKRVQHNSEPCAMVTLHYGNDTLLSQLSMDTINDLYNLLKTHCRRIFNERTFRQNAFFEEPCETY